MDGTPFQGGSIVTRASPYGLDATMNRLVAAIERRRLRLFALIDHDGAAEEVGLALGPRRVVIFGSPSAGTPLMARWPLVALQLPLKVLVWEAEDGEVRVSHLTTAALLAPVGIDPSFAASLDGLAAILDEVVSVD